MELQTHGTKKYPTSALLRSSAGLGWSTISAELRSHGVSETPVIVPQHMELCLAGEFCTSISSRDRYDARRISTPSALGPVFS